MNIYLYIHIHACEPIDDAIIPARVINLTSNNNITKLQ